jgi:serine/threonine-protein phosphatase 2A regulatory subunit B''
MQDMSVEIPRFFNGHGSSAYSVLKQKFLKESRTRYLKVKAGELLDEEDLGALLNMLRSNKVVDTSAESGALELIDYDGFKKAQSSAGTRFQRFFKPLNFLKMPRDAFGRVAIVPFFSCIVKRVSCEQTKLQLSYYDSSGTGSLRETDLENLVFDLLPTIPSLDSYPQEFHPFYILTAVRKFYFFLDVRRQGSIPISRLLESEVLKEFEDSRIKANGPGAERNMSDRSSWFHPDSALRIYNIYAELDRDSNGMLNKSELRRFGQGTLSEVIINRIFEECQTYENQLDYKGFLDLALAFEHRASYAGLKYVWRLFDSNKCGSLTRKDISELFRAVHRTLISRSMLNGFIDPDDVCDEVFDLILPAQPMVITFEDMLRSPHSSLVVGILTDATEFWAYDNRENTVMLQPPSQ